jgi:hypothetical protein
VICRPAGASSLELREPSSLHRRCNQICPRRGLLPGDGGGVADLECNPNTSTHVSTTADHHRSSRHPKRRSQVAARMTIADKRQISVCPFTLGMSNRMRLLVHLRISDPHTLAQIAKIRGPPLSMLPTSGSTTTLAIATVSDLTVNGTHPPGARAVPPPQGPASASGPGWALSTNKRVVKSPRSAASRR